MSGAVPKGAAPDCCGGSEGYRSEKGAFSVASGVADFADKASGGN